MASTQPGAPVRRITADRARVDLSRWPYTLGVVKQVVRHGLDLSPGLTILIGPNGS